MKTINKGSYTKIYWKIFKGNNKVTEDFHSLNTELKVFLVGSGNKYYMAHTINRVIEPGYDVIEIEIPSGQLETGVYDLRAIWWKNKGRDLLTSNRCGIFGVTDSVEEAPIEELAEIKIASYTENFGRDGMSAYETAVMYDLHLGITSEKEWVMQETIRIQNEEARKAAEEERKSNEASRVSEETKRVTAETGRKYAEGERVSQEATRKTAEEARNNAENARKAGETTRVAQEYVRINSENSRTSAENVRVSNENNRVEAEKKRVANEASREEAEDNREERFTQNEQNRSNRFNTAETARNANETSRVAAEGKRVVAESNRASNESTRVSNENQRIANENARKAAEEERQSTYKSKLGREDVVQTTGSSTEKVMSQKAVTDALKNAGGGGGSSVTIVNNLTEGGEDKALSAEMGKTLSERIEEVAEKGGGLTEIPDGGVTTAKIANGAVTNAKVAKGAIKLDNLADEVKTQLGVNTPDDAATTANAVYYDNTASGLESANVQGAIDEVAKETLSKLTKVDDKQAYLLQNHPNVVIEKGKCLRESFTIQNNNAYTLYTITLLEEGDYLYLLGAFTKYNAYYTRFAFFDENMVAVKTYSMSQLITESNGGVYNLRAVRQELITGGKNAPKFFVFSLANDDPAKDSIVYVQGDYTPFFDDVKAEGLITAFSRKVYNNIALDSGLATEKGLKVQAHYGMLENTDVNATYHTIALDRYLQDEDDDLMLQLNIARCVRYGENDYICSTKDNKAQEYWLSTNTVTEASQYKIMFIIEADDDKVNDVINSLKFTLQLIDTNLNPKYSFYNGHKFTYKLKDRYYLHCKYLACEGGYTETNQGMNGILRELKLRIWKTDLTTAIGFHGGWIVPTAWERNTIRDYSAPSIEQLKLSVGENVLIDEIQRIEEKFDKWKDVGILCVGTSYMNPNSNIAEFTADKLGCRKYLQNNGNVGGATRGVVGSGANGWKIGMSLTNAELKEASDNGVQNGSWMSTAILGYENLIMRYICDDNGYVDSLGNTLYRPEGYPRPSIMLVLDGHNEEHTPDVELTGVFGSKEQRGTYRGAWNYLLTEIYKVHPDLKVIFLSNPGITGEIGYEGLNVYEDNKKVVEQWNLPYVDFVTQLGVVNDYRKGDLTIYKADWGGNHYTNRCAERMAQILAAYLKGFVF